MYLPTLKKHVYASIVPAKKSSATIEAMLNIMQATYTVLQSFPVLGEDSLAAGRRTLLALLSHFGEQVTGCYRKYFIISVTQKSDDFQVKSRPSLGGVIEVAAEAIMSKHTAAHQECSTSINLVVEGLLAHFFSADQPKYEFEDVRWFLELVNKQKHWFSEGEEKGEPAALKCETSEDQEEESVSLKAQVQVNNVQD